MRKLLYATTALTAAALIAGTAGDATAQTAIPPSASPSPYREQLPAPPPAKVSTSAERIKLGLSGYFQQWGVFTDQSFKTRTGGTPAGAFQQQPTNFASEKHNSEICVIGQTTLDSGLTVGINVQIEANTSADQIDESYLFLQSPTFGQAILGDENNAAYLLHVTAPDGGVSLDSGDLLNIRAFETNGAPVFDTALGTTNLRLLDNDSGKFTYITPRFAGFQAGISFIPEFTSGGDNNSALRKAGITEGNGVAGGTSTTRGIYNGVAPGINYTNTFGNGFGVQASAGYLWAETGSGYGGTPAFNGQAAAPGADTKNLIAYNAGAQLSFAGFSVGGGWMYIPQGNSPNIGKLNGVGWTAGGAYEFGPYKVGLDYETGTQNAVSTGGVSRLEQAVLSGTYVLGPGIRLVGGIFAYDWDQENSISKNNNGIGGTTGLKLAF
jgi:hypothetical protein